MVNNGAEEEQKEFVYPIPENLEVINVNTLPEFDMNHFFFDLRFKPYVESVVMPAGMMQSRWERLAERILADHAGVRELVVLVLMNGAYRFYEDLKDKLDKQLSYSQKDIHQQLQIRPHFIKLSSYKDTASTGLVKGIEALEGLNLTGKNILIVEDILDTGTTMKAVLAKI